MTKQTEKVTDCHLSEENSIEDIICWVEQEIEERKEKLRYRTQKIDALRDSVDSFDYFDATCELEYEISILEDILIHMKGERND